jgi:hypothetical protein
VGEWFVKVLDADTRAASGSHSAALFVFNYGSAFPQQGLTQFKYTDKHHNVRGPSPALFMAGGHGTGLKNAISTVFRGSELDDSACFGTHFEIYTWNPNESSSVHFRSHKMAADLVRVHGDYDDRWVAALRNCACSAHLPHTTLPSSPYNHRHTHTRMPTTHNQRTLPVPLSRSHFASPTGA